MRRLGNWLALLGAFAAVYAGYLWLVAADFAADFYVDWLTDAMIGPTTMAGQGEFKRATPPVPGMVIKSFLEHSNDLITIGKANMHAAFATAISAFLIAVGEAFSVIARWRRG